MTRKNIERIAEIAQKHNLIVISDEIYEKFVYDGWEHVSIGALPGMAERTITLNGFSKTYAMTGWRVGYIAAPVSFIEAATRFKQVTNLAAPTLSQWGAHAALTGPQTSMDEFRAIYAERRALMKDALDEMGFTYGDPRGAFYVFANTRSTGMNATDFAYQLLERGACAGFSRRGVWRGMGGLRAHFALAAQGEIGAGIGTNAGCVAELEMSQHPLPRF